MQSQQSNSQKWDLSELFKSDNDPTIFTIRKVVEDTYKTFINNWQNRSDYLENAAILKQALQEYEVLEKKYGCYGREQYYFSLRSSVDEIAPEIKAKSNQINTLSRQLDNDVQFFTHRLSLVTKEIQHVFLNSSELVEYKHFLETLFGSAKYLLSENEEKILNLKSKTSYSNWLQMTQTFLSKESGTVIDEDGHASIRNFEEIMSSCNSKNKDTRDSAAKIFNEILVKHLDVGEVELNSILENKQIDDSLRKVVRPDALRHLADDIETDVVDKLLDAVSRKNDIAQKYYALKAKLLGVEKLKYHERNIEYGSTTKKYDFQESTQLVFKVFSELDPQFGEIFNSFIVNKRIDVYPQKGKRGGAFCAHHLITQPTYIMLNHTNDLVDVLTLAHEAGHGINNELIKLKQNALHFGTPTSTAEVASTFCEDFVLQELLKTDDDELRLSLSMTKLNSDISTVFRQIAAYKFEQELHTEFRKKGYLPKEEIGRIFQKNMVAYMGSSVEQSEGSGNWWLYWSHIRYFFYNYSYASGLLISKSMQAEVKKDHAFINKVKEFLSAGRAESPKNIFLKMGIDISDENFWLKGIQEVETLLEDTENLAKKLKKI